KLNPGIRPQPRSFSLLSGAGYRPLKRAVDVICASGLLLLFGPLMALIAIAIKLYSPGPVFYRQRRVGKHGVPFMMLKFRSMHAGNDSNIHRDHVRRLIRENIRPEDLGATSLKLGRDPRVTPLGRWLRALSLDELPQFINVLYGEMSLVGPRPPLPYEYELYQDWHKHRLSVLPGITGIWQVTARNQVAFDDMVRLDLAYIETMSLWLDLTILVRTPVAMLTGKGGG
ncbi:MAG: sugar transferase, partial [Chloroflexi bacterium]|nr:sugar transferase [Chloroflexota bacterium]